MKSLEEVRQQGIKINSGDNSLYKWAYERTKKRYKNALKYLANK